MADERESRVFRPKSVQPEEVNEPKIVRPTAAENQDILRKIQETQNLAASERGDPIPQHMEGGMPFEVKGNPPPGFEHFGKFSQSNQPPSPMVKKAPRNFSMAGVNEKLEAIIEKLQSSSQHYEEAHLPSMGKFYNSESPASAGILHIRKMTGEEEAVFAVPRNIKEGTAIDKIFSNCIRERLNPETLLSQDRNYLLIFLRGISHSPIYEVEVKCPACSGRFQYEIDLGALEVDYCPEDLDGNFFLNQLPVSGLNFRFRFATGKDELAASKRREKRAGDFVGGSTDDSMLYNLALLIEEIEGVNRLEEIMIILKKLTVADIDFLRGIMNDPPFGVDTNVEIYCPLCTEEFKIALPFDANFFFPHRRKRRGS